MIKKTVKTLAFLLVILFSNQANAWSFGEWIDGIKAGSESAWNDGDYELYVPFIEWHNRLTYDKEKYERYNEYPLGLGIGKGYWDGDEWHGLMFMVFEDSNHHPQTIGGYSYLTHWNLNEAETWKFGVGYALTLTQRSEYKFIPLPLPLPVASLNYKSISLQAAYVPGIKNDGNVLFAWVKWTF